jgi:hypothetical protein
MLLANNKGNIKLNCHAEYLRNVLQAKQGLERLGYRFRVRPAPGIPRTRIWNTARM